MASKDIQPCNNIKIEDFYFKEIDKLGSVKLFTPIGCENADKINKLILLKSENILSSEEKEKILNKTKIANFFTLDTMNYYKMTHNDNNVFNSGIETNVFFLGKEIVTYSIVIDSPLSKVGPLFEYINVDLKDLTILELNQIIYHSKKNNFEVFINSYVEGHKNEIISNYKESLAQGSGDLLDSYQSVFDQPFYDLKSVKLQLTANDFSHFSNNGVVFNVNVKDSNFLLDKDRNRIEEYLSEVTVPYKFLLNYFNKNSNLYKNLKKIRTN